MTTQRISSSKRFSRSKFSTATFGLYVPPTIKCIVSSTNTHLIGTLDNKKGHEIDDYHEFVTNCVIALFKYRILWKHRSLSEILTYTYIPIYYCIEE